MTEQKDDAFYLQTLECVPTYDVDAVRNAVDEQLTFLRIEEDVAPEMKVLIKPNLVGDYHPYFATTTHPVVVEAIADWLIRHGCRNVCIADSPAGAVSTMSNFDYDRFYQKVGYDHLERKGIQLNRDTGWGERRSPEGCKNKSFHLLNAVLNADYIINVPKLKTHNTTTVSFGIKNLFGCVPDIQKPVFHARYPRQKDFCNMLVELAMTVKPSLTVVDGIEIMEGNGPVAGEKRNLGMLFAAKDVFSQDRVLAELLGVPPDKIGMIQAAEQKGLLHSPVVASRTFVENTPIPPLKLPDVKTSHTVKERLAAAYHVLAKKGEKAILTVQPTHVPQNCDLCLRCVNSCPVHAISAENGKIAFQYDKCIGCLCCHETCSNHAIGTQKQLKMKKN
ncbi:MAG: DUF362 domain-containing protein [Clostridia bacterium]|nr:DUF362 domain-containing protein [Clostridia bacterium]